MRYASTLKAPSWWRLADPYLRWAHHTGFQYFKHARGEHFGVLVELKSPLDRAQRMALEKATIFVAKRYNGERFVTAELDLGKRDSQLDAFARIGALHVELATPIATPRAQDESAVIKVSDSPERLIGAIGKNPKRLIGVIDDGCPFAHAELLSNGASRVAFLWDQGAGMPRVRKTSSDYGYGHYYHGGALARAIELGTPPGGIAPDEDAVYEIAGQERLRPLASHGAHVLGLAAAAIPAKNRISPSRFAGSDATEQPSWNEVTDSDAALAFVQIPKDSLNDSSGHWLDRNILDGIHALLDFALATKTVKRATINVSYGPQTGPHDGSSLLERAIDDLVANQKRIAELFIVLPAGNSYQSRAHAEFDLAQRGGPVTWHVPPDSETPAFLEIWLPRATTLAEAEVRVSSADDLTLAAVADRIVEAPGGSWQILACNTAPAGTPDQWVVLVALGATGGYDAVARPPHGRWSVRVSPIGAKRSGLAHAYLARNDYNFGGLRRGKLSHLWLENYDPNRFMRSREDDPPAGTPQPAVRIHSAGSVSGLATGAHSGVAAGYRIADRQPAIYSCGGPSRGMRAAPDWAYPTDESRVLPGLISWGNRSGASVRLTGTSAAAPQYARNIDIHGKKAQPPPGGYPDPRLGSGRR